MCGCAACTTLRAKGLPLDDEASAYLHLISALPEWQVRLVIPLMTLFAVARL